MQNKVYYNSACPICNAGIKNQRKRMEACGLKNIEWIDINTNPDAALETGASLNQIRERLHVKDTNGQLSIGLDAFTHLWSQTNRQRWLAKLLQILVFKQASRLTYNLFAHLLYRWNCNKKRW
jgi:predicted DCC family thiol-disulfide oxidoreductase YuxK